MSLETKSLLKFGGIATIGATIVNVGLYYLALQFDAFGSDQINAATGLPFGVVDFVMMTIGLTVIAGIAFVIANKITTSYWKLFFIGGTLIYLGFAYPPTQFSNLNTTIFLEIIHLETYLITILSYRKLRDTI